MEELEVPGAVVAVVSEGKVLLLKGYGLADAETRRPVDAQRTVFHVASISKPVTASALLRLAERGELDLDADVNRYLRRMSVPTPFGRPVTVSHLLTHTAGLDEHTADRKRRRAAELTPLAAYLAGRQPAPARPPGEVSVYSNHGYALAGLVLEEVSGQPFAVAVRDSLFAPLGMTSTAYGPAPEIEARLARGYGWQGARGEPLPLDYIQTGPASMLLTSGADLSRWMLAMLEGGILDGERVLSPESTHLLLSRRFSNHPLIPGRSFGLSEGGRFDPPEFLHAGGASGFTSALVMLPDHRAGLFVSFNSRAYIWETVNRLLDRFEEGIDPPAAEPLATMPIDPTRFTGYYRQAEISTTTAEKLAGLFRQERVRPAENGRIRWRADTWEAIDPLAFRRVGGSARLGFVERDGEPRYLSYPGTVLERVRWRDSPPAQFAAWSLFVLVFAASGLGWLFRYLPRRKAIFEPQDAFRPRWPLGLASLAALLQLGFVIALGVSLARALGGGEGLEYGVPPSLRVILTLPLVAGGLSLMTALVLPVAWWRHFWTPGTRLRFTLAVLALCAFLPFLDSWNLLGFKF